MGECLLRGLPLWQRNSPVTISYVDAGQMHLYLNYAREHWMKAGENPPVGLILCAEKGGAEAHYALDSLPNKVLAAEYQTVLPDEKLIAEELERSRLQLEERRQRPNQQD
jgi:YhcG PDDEXK nuclease domain